jgi:hypothetical protein
MKFLGILSLPRSGTNHLSHNILASNSRVVNLGEVFHNDAAGVKQVSIFPFFPSFESFRSAVANDPAGTLRRITEGFDADIAVFKVFPYHLDRHSFERLALAIDGFVVLTRNPLSTWVSNRIAHETGVWRGQRTDDHIVSWNPADFIEHSIERLGYLNDRVSFLQEHNVPFIELSYAQISQVDADPSGILDAIATAIPALDGIKPNAALTTTGSAVKKSKFNGEEVVIFKQDKRTPLLRIEDWQLANADLEHWGLQSLTAEDAQFDRVALANILIAIHSAA